MENIEDLRNTLLQVISDVKAGKMEVNKAQAICSVSNSIINLTKLQMEYNGDDAGILFMNQNDADDDISASLAEIEQRNKETYKPGTRL